MNWELGALKILAKNTAVPGVVLRDAIGEIEKLQKSRNRSIEENGKLRADRASLRAELAECQELLVEMVNQYCRNNSDEPTTYSHDFMSTGEAVFEYLVNHGLAEWDLNGIDIRLRKVKP
jgi:phage host-nuclease inhibitor protein Gam